MRILSISLIKLAFLICFSAPAQAEDVLPQFSVTGMGQVHEAPDMATISLGVSHQADTAAEALALMRAGSASVFKSLQPFEFEPRDLQTSQLQLSPQWERYKTLTSGSGQKISGYVASNIVTVRIRDLGKLGAVMDAVGDGGANQFNGLQFGFAEPGPLMDKAREAAMQDALRKARMMAAATGVELGRVLSMHESGNQRHPQAMAETSASFSRDAIPVAAGESSLTAQFTITYELLN